MINDQFHGEPPVSIGLYIRQDAAQFCCELRLISMDVVYKLQECFPCWFVECMIVSLFPPIPGVHTFTQIMTDALVSGDNKPSYYIVKLELLSRFPDS